MSRWTDLVASISSLLQGAAPASSGALLVLGEPALAAALAGAGVELRVTAGCSEAEAAKVSRRFPELPLITAEAGTVPLAPGSLDALVVVDGLGGAGDPLDRVAGWAALLGPGRPLLLLERPPGSLWGGLRRLGGKGPPPSPEALCALLLNLGLRRVGQLDPAGRPARLLTFGHRAA